MSAISFLGYREPLMGLSPPKWGLIPEPEIEARLGISNSFAGVTRHLPEMNIWGSYFIQSKLEMVPKVWEDAKMVEALEYQGLMDTWRLGEVLMMQLLRKGRWEAGW